MLAARRKRVTRAFYVAGLLWGAAAFGLGLHGLTGVLLDISLPGEAASDWMAGVQATLLSVGGVALLLVSHRALATHRRPEPWHLVGLVAVLWAIIGSTML